MASRIPKETIDRVFEAAKIEEVVSDYVSLKKRGANMIGLCPFHNEKTGSFTVSPSKGIYKCFGCSKAGHAVDFIMDIEQCNFMEAVKQLAKKYHIEIEEREMTEEEQQLQDNRESMFVVNDAANQWFQDQLWNTPEGQAIGLSYFRERGLREDTIRKFQLGYSPEKGNQLSQHLIKKGYKEQYITNNVDTQIGTGLSGKSEDGKLYDRFRDRVIFPIHTVSGKTVAFAGRILKKKYDKNGEEIHVGKYVNSPDSIIYSKTHELFGLFFAKQSIVRQNLCYMVEGQMDVISMHQAGIENVVCSGGTALTTPQIRLIRRFTNNITVIYDGDAAGIHAALRGIDMFLEEGFNVKVLLLPDGEDPDSFARSHNASDFIDYIQAHQVDFIRYKVQTLGEDAGNDPVKRSELVKSVALSISKIPDAITRQIYIKDSSDRLQMPEQILLREVSRLRREEYIEKTKKQEEKQHNEDIQIAIQTAPTTNEKQTKTSSPFMENFRNLIQVIVKKGEIPLYVCADGTLILAGEYILQQLEQDRIVFPDPVFRKIAEEYTAHCHEPGFKAEAFFKFHEDEQVSHLAVQLIADQYQLSRIFQKQTISENVVKTNTTENETAKLSNTIYQLLMELKYAILLHRIENLESEIKIAQETKDTDRQLELLKQLPPLTELRNQFCKQLGNRVITP